MGPQESLEVGSDDPSPVYLRKIFVGNLDHSITEDILREYLNEYGEISELVIMSNGWAFCIYAHPESVDNVMGARPHVWEDGTLEIVRATPEDQTGDCEDVQTRSLHVSGIQPDMSILVLQKLFSQFGKVVNISILMDQAAALVEFDDWKAVDKACLKKNIFVNDVEFQVKKHVAQSNGGHIRDEDFEKNVLMKLDKIKNLQLQQLLLLQNLPTNINHSNVQDVEDIISSPSSSFQELIDLSSKISDPEFKIKMINFMRTLDCAKPGDTVRKIMRKIATNDVLANFSYKGRGQKCSFEQLQISDCIIKACKKIHPEEKSEKIEELISETLRFAPHRIKIYPKQVKSTLHADME